MMAQTFISRWRDLAGSVGSLRRQLVRGGIGSALIRVINQLLSLALGIILARSLGAEGYGVYVYAFALFTVLLVFSELGMPTLLLREVAAAQALQDWSRLRGVTVRASQIVLTASVASAMAVAFVLWKLRAGLSAEQINTLTWVIVLLPLTALTKTITSAIRGLQHVVKAQALEMLMRPALVLLGVGALFALAQEKRLPQNAMTIQLGVAIVMLCVAAVTLYRCLPQLAHTAIAKFRTRDWLFSAIPLTLIGSSGIINAQADILMLGVFRSSEDVATYRVAVQGAMLVAFGLQTANSVIAPQFARLYAQGDNERLQRLVTASARVVLLAALPVAVAFVLAGGTIASWVFGPEFAKSHTPLAILSAGQLVNAAMGSVGFLLNMTGHERDTARIMLFTAALNILLNLALIPAFGSAGAASATTVSLALWNIFLFRAVKKRIGINSTAFTLKRT